MALYEVWGPLVASHLVDITADIDTKLAALRHYESAMAGIDYARTAKGLAAYRSGQGMGGIGYAEAFASCLAARTPINSIVTDPRWGPVALRR